MVGMMGGWAGLAVGGVYGWASWIYSYNREAWMNDIQVRQAHDFQYENMQIATHGMSREEVRDRTQAAITKLSNYILVTTLILSLAAEMLVEGQVPRDCADFVLNVYMLCLGSSVFYLVLSVLFGVAASNVIYESSAKLLTDKVPPPWPRIDVSMRSRQQEEHTRAFEQRPWREMFMPPLFQSGRLSSPWGRLRTLALARLRRWGGPCAAQPLTVQLRDHEEEGGAFWPPEHHGGTGSAAASGGFISLGAAAPARRVSGLAAANSGLEAGGPPEAEPCRALTSGFEGELDRIEKDYDKFWQEYECLWAPLKLHSGVCAALGLRNLLQAYGYLCMATLYGDNGSAWTFWAVQLIFVSLNVLIMQFLREGFEPMHTLLLTLSPISCAVAATTPWICLDRILVPVCYFCHLFLAVHEGCELRVSCQEASEPSTPYFGCGADHSTAEPCSQHEDCGTGRTPQTPHVLFRNFAVNSPIFASLQGPDSPPMRSKSAQTRVLVHRLMHSGLLVVQCLWVFSALWALCIATFNPGDFKNSKAIFGQRFRPPVADLTTLKTSWSPYFRPSALVCPRGRVFLADEFRIFELSRDTGTAAPYSCDINGTIEDLTADCDSTGCWPLVLLAGNPSRMLDCSTGVTQSLLQTVGLAQHVALLSYNDLFADLGGQVVRYRWSDHRRAWSPVWAVAQIASGGLNALDVVDHRLLMFGKGAVEVQDLENGRSCGVWQLPAEVKGAGCAIEGGTAVLLLGQKERAEVQGGVGGLGPGVELMCADLRRSGESPCASSDNGGVSAEIGTKVRGCQALLQSQRWKGQVV
eukprot:CAMPEP_0204157934 /NCGR_PEP_ID=MMETSP0361-20130328/31664_1 /ASSEMBLY_ACC=CAM_ASM_000343 /TAXON_ID=268821 /ORGANISM="Scrippsiella Hangoei, Strain SHTV-5" /LENGTH=807 /DNA_ID=CAMNT_0051113785 /DNA_START=26 /DNA_END=2449 /DNA_ORIENTATION=-